MAKIVVWAPSRSMAIEKMIRILSQTVCIGLSTNQLFLQSCLQHGNFRSVDYSTSFIPNNLDSLLTNFDTAAQKLPLNLYSIVPCLFSRKVQGQGRSQSMFGTVRLGFRNQTFDKVNHPCDIVTRFSAVHGKDEDPRICRLSFIFDPKSRSATLSVKISPLPERVDSVPNDKDVSSSAPVTRAYNALSVSLRSGKVPDEEEYPVAVHSLNNQRVKFEMVPLGRSTKSKSALVTAKSGAP